MSSKISKNPGPLSLDNARKHSPDTFIFTE